VGAFVAVGVHEPDAGTAQLRGRAFCLRLPLPPPVAWRYDPHEIREVLMGEIVTRTFRLSDQPDVEIRLSVEIPISEGLDFRCQYKIDWPEGAQHGHGMGVDALQALLLALKCAAVDISCSKYAKEEKLVWLEMGMGFGLPLDWVET
jgi:hypothetical protein